MIRIRGSRSLRIRLRVFEDQSARTPMGSSSETLRISSRPGPALYYSRSVPLLTPLTPASIVIEMAKKAEERIARSVSETKGVWCKRRQEDNPALTKHCLTNYMMVMAWELPARLKIPGRAGLCVPLQADEL
ncbi:hypothetical protein BD311DRAFT_827756 [Dichomitus squalens]|uniref:Uncharacterized protein n=1 Tax=Dichomitus squalens TaxID=114155 RepID=A0A4Q9M4B9_9APHY|nr:hypothetical protein BD311DRAFT_827756 [Dichomitus squalens]